MDKTDKENVKVKTRIPLPLVPLPPLPNHLLKKLSDRPPLNTLAGPNGHNNNVPTRFDSDKQCFAGPSNLRDQTFIECDDSDCYLVASQDDKRRISEPSVICISTDDDDEDDPKEKETYFTDKDGLANKRRKSASTPRQTLQPARVKNITRSLKRPHSSRQLQEITPLENSEKGDDDRAKRRQTVRERMQSPDFLQKSYMASIDQEYAREILSYLLRLETKPVSLPQGRSETRAWVINWLMKINGVDGNPATIQTAVWYLDAMQATGNVASTTATAEWWHMQLKAAASYLIAAKIHGPRTSASKLVKYSNNAFTAQRLLETEKIILVRLKFPRQPVIPQDFLRYFAWWCNEARPGEIEVATTFLCLCGLMVNKSLCQEYPSVVAAASVMNALLLLRKNELIPRLQMCPAFVAAKDKATKLSHTCTILRHAVRMVAAKDYSHKFIFEQYGVPPKCIAQTLASAANKLAVDDTKGGLLTITDRSALNMAPAAIIPSQYFKQK